MDIVRDTTSIQFHTAKLKLGHAKLMSPTLSQPLTQEASSLKYDEEEERATLELPTTLPAGSKAQLKIDFEGELTGAMMGYYRSAWEHEGKTAYYSLTQFEVRYIILIARFCLLHMCSLLPHVGPSLAGTSPRSKRRSA